MSSSRLRLRSITGTALVLLAGIVAVGSVPSTASAAGTGSISGIVTGGATGGQLILAGPCAAAYDSSGNQVGGMVRADSDGHYELSGLETGDYRVEFIDCAARLDPDRDPYACVGAAVVNCLLPGLPSEFYDNKRTLAEATPISVTDGQATTGINGHLGADGVISGTVTDSLGIPLYNICVDAYDSEGQPAGTRGLTVSGHYEVKGLDTGDYVLKFSDCQHPEDPSATTEYYDDASSMATAEPVSAKDDGVTTGIDAQLVTKPQPAARAAIGKVTAQGPAKARKGKPAVFHLKIKNSGDAAAEGVKLSARARGITSSWKLGSIPSGATKKIVVTLKPKKTGSAKLTFKVTSANAGGKSVTKRISVRP